MMGETQHVYVTSNIEPGAQDKDLNFEQFSKKDVCGTFDGELLGGSESRLHSREENGSGFTSAKDKEPQHQREAVIRPQQAGKIDFRSLHNRPKFPSDSPWGAVKGSPQSPTGKSRARDKSKRSGKGERGHHQQLYRLTIGNARPNPTIGIAYPQQKVTPPKKVEFGRGPVSGSYRFHVPSNPEREVELQQEDRSFARCFPDTPSSHVPSDYTSPAVAARPNHGPKVQPAIGVPHASPGSGGQLHYQEFQENGNNPWHTLDKSLPGANSGLPTPKPCSFPESNKANSHCLGPSAFQYPFPALHSLATDPFPGDATSQDYVNLSLATSQANHGALAFHSSSRDWKEEVLGNGPYENVTPESKLYGLVSPLTQFLQSQTPGHLPCYKGRNELSTDHIGAISSPGAIDQNPSTLQENQAVFQPSLHVSSMPKPIGKRQPSLKDSVAGPRTVDSGSLLRRNSPQISLPQVHFQNKAYSDPPVRGLSSPAPVSLEKNPPTAAPTQNRLLQIWEGGKRPYSPMEQNAALYTSPVGNQLSFGIHLGPEQGHPTKKTWQQVHLTSAMPSQNRIELSRKLASQKLPFPPEWEEGSKTNKAAATYSSKVLLTGEGAVIQRHDPLPQNCSSANAFCFEGAKDADLPAGCGSRSKSFFFSVSQLEAASSRLPSSSTLVAPPSALVASPSESPLPSPAPNPASGSTCSSLSPMSSSPSSHSFEDGTPLTASPFFQQQSHPKDGNKPIHVSEPLYASSLHHHTADPVKAFHFSQEALKEDLIYKGLPMEGHFHKPSVDISKGCLEGFETEVPPPPYSSHHLLASSLSSTSLDQLDVFLTCKQCDQNFSNLSSFFEHRQFCNSPAALQGQARENSRGTEIRKQQHLSPHSGKQAQAALGPLLLPDPQLQLLALNKAVDFPADGEGKGESRDDPLKVNQLGSLSTNPLPLSASDLDIDDAKLDSLITEALNGLGYQSDNPEIDSSFIDVFADEELTSVKVASSGASYKAKDGLALGTKMKLIGMDENVKVGSCYDDHPSEDLAKNRVSGKQPGPEDRVGAWFPDHRGERFENQSGGTDLARSKAVDPAMYDRLQINANTQQKIGRKSCCGSFPPVKQVTKTFSEPKQMKNVKSSPSPGSDFRSAGEIVVAAGNAKPSAKDAKKRKLRSGTWSKELIHKIVQQKNKLHKLHPKSTKTVSLSLLADRLLPDTKDSKFGEYEYISESDDERVEYAKRHCRRKLGSRLGGRLKSSFGRRHQARGGREKGKELAWSHGQRKARDEPKRALGKEARRKDNGVARLRSRRNRSSTSSCLSTTFSSETSGSPQSTERADSDTEKESEPAGPLPRELLHVPERETLERNPTVASDWSGEPDNVDAAKILPPGFKMHHNDSPDVSSISYANGEEGLRRTREDRHCGKATLDNSPAVLFSSDHSEQYDGESIHSEDKPRATSGAPEPCDLGIEPRWLPFPAYNGQYHGEELMGPSSIDSHRIPMDENAVYEKMERRHLEKQKEFIAPISCFSNNPVGLGMAEKGLLVNSTDTFYDCKELSSSYESPGLFSSSPAIESPHSGNVYLSPGDLHADAFKPKHPAISPYEAEQSRAPSPLSFDSSSVFGDIPVADFDTTLYDSVSSGKESYVPFPCATHPLGKMAFDQQYSPFLQEKDWNQLVEVSPVLPEDLAPFHSLPVEKPLSKRFPVEISQLPLPERIASYNEPFMQSVSDDDLEIKRLVTELESQLQTSKLTLEASEEHQTPEHHTDTEQKGSVNQFSPLTLEEQDNGKELFLVEGEFENTALLSTKACLCEHSANEKTLLPDSDTKFRNHPDLWPCSVQFSPLRPTINTSSVTDLALVGPFSSKESHNKLPGELKEAELCGEDGFMETSGASTRILPESDNMEVPSYTEHLMRSSDPLFPKTVEAAELNIHETLPLEADGFPELQQKEKLFDGAAELEPFGPQVPCLEPGFGLQEEMHAHDDDGLQHVKGPEEIPLTKAPEELETRMPVERDEDTSVLLEQARETESAVDCTSPAPCDKVGDEEASLLESLPCSKEVERSAEHAVVPQRKSANPLQQLQLFVARTAQSNEEDLRLPCLPGLPSSPLVPTSANTEPGQEEGIADGVLSADAVESPAVGERKGSVGDESGSEAPDLPELCLETGERVDEMVCPMAEPPVFPCPEQGSVSEHLLKEQCSAVADINRCTDGLMSEHSRLPLLGNSVATSFPREEGTQGAQVTGEQKKAALAFRSDRKSPLSLGSLEQDAAGQDLPAVLQTQVTRCATWVEASSQGRAPRLVKTQQMELGGGQSQHDTPVAPAGTSVNHYPVSHLLHKAGFCAGISPGVAEGNRGVGISQDDFPVQSGSADLKGKREDAPIRGPLSDFGEPAPRELCGRTTPPQSQSVPHRGSFEEEEGAIRGPSEHKEWKDALPFAPVLQHYNTMSPLLLDGPGSLRQRLAEGIADASAKPPKDVVLQVASSQCLDDPTTPLAKTERLLQLQSNSGRTPNVSSFMQKGFSEGFPKSPGCENSNTLSARDVVPSSPSGTLQGIFLGPSPSEASSSQRREEEAEEISTHWQAEEMDSCPPEVSKDESPQEVFNKDVVIQEPPAPDLSNMANAEAGSHFPDTECSHISQNTDSTWNTMKKEGCEQDKPMEGSSSPGEREESRDGCPKEDSNTGRLDGKELQAACAICSISFRSKTGLMRHRAVKHQANKDSVPLVSPGPGPSTPAAKTHARSSAKERVRRSHIPKMAAGQMVARAYRNRRKEPSTEIQEVVSRVLSDLSVMSCDLTRELQSVNRLSGGGRQTTSARGGESIPNSGKDPGGKESGAKPVRSGSFAEKKRRRNGGKAQGKGDPKQTKPVGSSSLHNAAIEVHSQGILRTVDPTLAAISEERESGSPSAEARARSQSSLLPRPLTISESEADERKSSAQERAGEHTPQGAGDSSSEGIGCPALGEKLHTEDSWRAGSPKQVEKPLSNPCEGQHGSVSGKVSEVKETPLEEASGRDHDGLFMLKVCPKSQQRTSDSGVDQKGSTEGTSGKAAEATLHLMASKPCGNGELRLSHESCTDSPDLQDLFDDEATFSQLFPRKDQFARRKCTRVYGKRTKRVTPMAEVNPRPEGTTDLFTIRMPSDLGETSSFCVTRDDPCEYETISINDALLLNMCHGNKATPNETSSCSAKDLSLQPEAGQREEPDELTAEQPLVSSSLELPDGPSVMEASPEPPHLEEEPYDARRNRSPALPEFHTIDMEMLNAKFETKDLPYYHAEEDHLHHPEECSLGLKPTPVGHNEPIKNKLEEGKQGKPRSDLNLKTKEKQYKCKVCFQWFLTLGELDFHKLTHNPSPPPTCYMCVQRKFSSREQLRDHLKEKHAKNKAGLWTCGMCLKEISDVWMYNEHLREHATQFARKGQAQKSVLGMPGCFADDDAAVTHFLNSILCRKPSKSSKNVDPGSKSLAGKRSKNPKEPQGQEGKVSKDPFESLVRIKAPASSPKVPSGSSPDPAPKLEGPPKMVPMHPECKDPSRDCHHCGKQFPKPFKLQRHLVVHSLQKIYLCHRCPVFYQETKELQSHLSQEHRTAEKLEIKHTTLYACELCADVMHVIKKSFICSTCNYTFSKKEQYDRHMEKHLVGSNRTFRFRGVLRPGVFPKGGDKKIKEELRPREGVPAAKKKKVLHHSISLPPSSPGPVDGLHYPQLDGEALLPAKEPLTTAVTTTPPPPTPVKTEHRRGEFSGLLTETEPVHLPSPTLLAHQHTSNGPEIRNMAEHSVGQLVRGGSPDEIPPLFSDSPDPVSIDLASLAHKQTEAQKLSPPRPSEKHKPQADVPGKGTFNTEAEYPRAALHNAHFQGDPVSKMPETPTKSSGVTECKVTGKGQWIGNPNPNETLPPESAFKLNVPEPAVYSLPLKDKTSSPTPNRSARDAPSKKVTSSQVVTEKDTNTQNSLLGPGEVQKDTCSKDKASPEMGTCSKDSRTQVGVKDTGTAQSSPVSGPLRNEPGATQVRHNHSESSRFQERPVLNGLAKPLPKKRREHKSAHKGSSASRENIEGEGGKKKKVRVPQAMKGGTARSFKRAEWSNGEALALSPRRGDTHCNKLTPKPKMSMAGGHLKKMVLDQYLQKKVEIRHSNGDLKRKKEVLGKTYHPLLAKDSSTSLASSLNRHRTVHGGKLPDAHHYRTAESQNNLLSQLFGQKLTSFKIPLRRDTSE